MSQQKQTGFTLIEVLVALLILTIVMLSIGMSSASSIRNTTRVRQHMLATWVAENILTKMQLGEIGTNQNQDNQTVTMDGQTWYWTATVGDAAFGKFVPVTIAVAATQNSGALVQQTAYVVES